MICISWFDRFRSFACSGLLIDIVTLLAFCILWHFLYLTVVQILCSFEATIEVFSGIKLIAKSDLRVISYDYHRVQFFDNDNIECQILYTRIRLPKIDWSLDQLCRQDFLNWSSIIELFHLVGRPNGVWNLSSNNHGITGT